MRRARRRESRAGRSPDSARSGAETQKIITKRVAKQRETAIPVHMPNRGFAEAVFQWIF